MPLKRQQKIYVNRSLNMWNIRSIGFDMDHTLAVFHGLLRHPEKRVIVLGEREAMVMLPAGARLSMAMPVGARVSLFPLIPVRAVWSEGLEWPVDGLNLAAGQQVGTSNRMAGERLGLQMQGPGCLLMVERDRLNGLVEAMTAQG